MSSPTQSHREYFFDPFAAGNSVVTDDDQHRWLQASPVHERLNAVVSLGIPVYQEDTFDLSIKGQGVIAVRVKEATAVTFVIDTVDEGPSLYVNVTEHTIDFSYGAPGEDPTQLEDVLATEETARPGHQNHSMERKYLRPDEEATYWLSLDQNHGVLRYGKDYLSPYRTLAQVELKYRGAWVWAKDEYEQFGEWMHVQLTTTSSTSDASPALKIVYPMPIVDALSPYLISDQTVTLAQLATGVVTVPATLSQECQLLHANVAGPRIVLDTDEDMEEGFVFSEAIERSVNTPGLIGYEKLMSKVGELGDDFEGTSLRIMLGMENRLRDGPGIPYILELWPAGHYSTIHDHGNAFAVIKVLHGDIQATYYDSLALPVRQLGPAASMQKGDITWLSPSNYQVHKLHNTSTEGKVCCTLQCYKYGTDDMQYYKHFNYFVDVDGDTPVVVKKLEPTSDWDFSDFVKLIREEWDSRPRDE